MRRDCPVKHGVRWVRVQLPRCCGEGEVMFAACHLPRIPETSPLIIRIAGLSSVELPGAASLHGKAAGCTCQSRERVQVRRETIAREKLVASRFHVPHMQRAL